MFWKKKSKSTYFKRYLLYTIGLILAISAALPAYTQSNFLKQYISVEAISLFFVGANAITALILNLFPRFIKRLGSYFTIKLLILIYISALVALAAANGAVSAIFSLLIFIITANLIWISMDVLLESVSSDSKTGRIRSTYLTCINLGWIASPMLSAYLINTGGYSLPFIASSILAMFLFFAILSQKKSLKDNSRHYNKESINKSWRRLWRDKNLRGIFIAAISLNLFFSAAVLYIPLYLHQTLGMDWSQLGWIFSFMLIPFILFEIPAGVIADKYIGEKELLLLGIFILVLSLLLFFYLETTSALVWAAALFFSRTGAALIEAMRDSYFFKKISHRDLGLINVFRMTVPIGYIVGAGSAAIVIAFLPINYVFLIFAIIMLPVFYFTASIKDTR